MAVRRSAALYYYGRNLAPLTSGDLSIRKSHPRVFASSCKYFSRSASRSSLVAVRSLHPTSTDVESNPLSTLKPACLARAQLECRFCTPQTPDATSSRHPKIDDDACIVAHGKFTAAGRERTCGSVRDGRDVRQDGAGVVELEQVVPARDHGQVEGLLGKGQGIVPGCSEVPNQ